MSFAELKEKVVDLTPAELEELGQIIEAARPQVRRATPEMLAERRRLSEEIMRGEWNAELAGYEGAQARDREKNKELHRRWTD
ncbi:MAG TPA: hypothetical protein VGO11_17845 [Chthoniobacteraceae bacterium]|jgi:hypothetical protein|nr:hypothetical protein [Chthoniobacteraceae bacterium]